MIELKKEEMLNVFGGAGVSASMLNALSRAVTTLLDLGRSLGTAIRRSFSGKICSI